MAGNQRSWTAHTVEQRQAWHAIIALVLHTDEVGRGIPS